MPIAEVYALTIELAVQSGAPQPLKNLPGCWEYRFDDGSAVWWFAINGHDAPQRFEPNDGLCMGLDVPPYNVAVICNGWIAGLVDAGGGGLVGPTESDVISALKSELEKLKMVATGA